jgi:hypothetical protein
VIWYYPCQPEVRFGREKCLNLSPLVLCSHFYLLGLGNCAGPQRCSGWVGQCQVCSKTRTWLQGIFCTHYVSRCGIFAPCQKMWCGECYTSHPTILFHVKQREGFQTAATNEADCERLQRAWGKKHRSPDEYLVGRDGDHFLVPFECDLCVFRKLRMYDPSPTSEQDRLLLACI